MEQLILKMVFQDVDAVLSWLTQIGIKCSLTSSGELIAFNPELNMNNGICWERSDYTTRAVMLGFILFGPYWTNACPNLLDLVNNKWREFRKGN